MKVILILANKVYGAIKRETDQLKLGGVTTVIL